MAEPKSSGQPSDERLRRWHRLFGLLLSDHLADSPFSVVLEMDLSHKQQLLDVVVIRRRPGRLARPLPDGFDDLGDHNLITFKSYWEALTDWVLKELTGHYVNYRKQVSPRGRLLSEDRFRLIAVCARRPRDLFAAWLARGRRCGAREPYRSFYQRVQQAIATARLKAEVETMTKNPFYWLRYGPGRETSESPG